MAGRNAALISGSDVALPSGGFDSSSGGIACMRRERNNIHRILKVEVIIIENFFVLTSGRGVRKSH
jgi:hypothetical protein